MDTIRLYPSSPGRVQRTLTKEPFSITVDEAATLSSYDRLIEFAAASGRIIPGRDPLVLPRYQTPGAAAGDIATNPDKAHDTTWGTAGEPYIAMASSQVSAGRLVGFSVTAPVS